MALLIGVAIHIVRNRNEAVGVNDIDAVTYGAGFPGPARAARRVSRRQVRSDRDVAELERLSVADATHVGHRWKRRRNQKLRIAAIAAATLDGSRAIRTRDNRRVRNRLQLGDAAGMIEMRVRVEDVFHVFDAKTELADVGLDLRGRLGERTVNQNVPCVGRDEYGAESVRSDVPGITVDAEWIDWLIPFLA